MLQHGKLNRGGWRGVGLSEIPKKQKTNHRHTFGKMYVEICRIDCCSLGDDKPSFESTLVGINVTAWEYGGRK